MTEQIRLASPENVLKHARQFRDRLSDHVDGAHVRFDVESYVVFLNSVIAALEYCGVGSMDGRPIPSVGGLAGCGASFVADQAQDKARP